MYVHNKHLLRPLPVIQGQRLLDLLLHPDVQSCITPNDPRKYLCPNHRHLDTSSGSSGSEEEEEEEEEKSSSSSSSSEEEEEEEDTNPDCAFLLQNPNCYACLTLFKNLHV
jgi:hypothetical protein